MADLTAVTDRVHFAHTDMVNWTLVTDDDAVVLIDAGYPGQRAEVLDSVRKLGFDVRDIRAVLLTHAHVDHLGSAVWLAKTHGIPVFCHSAEVAHARRDYLEQASPAAVARHLWRPRWLKWSLALLANGGMDHSGIPTAQALDDADGLAIQVATPGHTGGHCSYLVDGVLVTGDALITGHPLAASTGPQLLPRVFNHDQQRCIDSLHTLATVDAEVVLPGHGPVWRGPVAEAAQQAVRAAQLRSR